MTEWKEVNKELPKGNCKVILKIYDSSWGGAEAELEGYFENFDDDMEIANIFAYEIYLEDDVEVQEFIEKDNFINGCQEITHWAYINKPIEPDKIPSRNNERK